MKHNNVLTLIGCVAMSLAGLVGCRDSGAGIPAGGQEYRSIETVLTDSADGSSANTADARAESSPEDLCTSSYFGGQPTDLLPLAKRDDQCAAPKPGEDSHCFAFNALAGQREPGSIGDFTFRWLTLDEACQAFGAMSAQE